MQQNTIDLIPGHPAKALTGLARQIALPHEFAPMRFPSFPSLDRTAVMGFNYNDASSVAISGENKAMLCRQAAWPYWVTSTDTVQGGTYTVVYALNVGVSTWTTNTQLNVETPVHPDVAVNYWKTGNQTASAAQMGVIGGAVPSFYYPVIGVDNALGPTPYVYWPGGQTLVVTITNAAPISATSSALFRFNLEYWTSPGEAIQSTAVQFVTVAAGNTGGALGLINSDNNNAWVRCTSMDMTFGTAGASATLSTPQMGFTVSQGTANYTPSVVTRGQITVTPGAAKGLVPGQYPVEFGNSVLPWTSTRVTAVSALYTNVTQVLNKAGTVLAGRIAPQVTNPFLVDATYVGSLHPAEKAYLPLETGHYTYCPPSTDLVDFWDYSLNTIQGAAACPVYRLDNTSLVNVAFFNSPVLEQLAVNLDWHIEFRTTSALFQVGLSTATIESLHQAQLALASIGYFFPNDTHKSLISKVLSAAGKWGSMLYPALVRSVPYANTALAVAKGAHDMLFQNKPAKAVPATSAKGSGIVPAKAAAKKVSKVKKVKVKRSRK